ncbi:hypothetical protein SAMN04488012_11529 [Palleronia salina]|uniref:Uncharacterized protein n=2 Tax=Palleronia TaxID=315422 RepID=A0A1M6LER0_9RHOB|nr:MULTISPECIES: hypothetical protein [Palleronia]SEO04354.1 hypothetical protein SAMN04488011_11070 [Palleronia pelagia]SHJ69628.1 hypothetical protein SAMN04488012_11529 [Palleronia salina]
MMDRLVDRVLRLEHETPFLDRAVLALGAFSITLSLAGTVLLYT